MENIFTYPGTCGRHQCGRDHQQCSIACNRFAVAITPEFPNNDKREFRVLQELGDRLVLIRNNFFTYGRLYQENRRRQAAPVVVNPAPYQGDVVLQAMANAELFPDLNPLPLY